MAGAHLFEDALNSIQTEAYSFSRAKTDTPSLHSISIDTLFSFLYYRRHFTSMSRRATISWLPTSRPSQAKLFRKFWCPSWRRSTRGRSRAKLVEKLVTCSMFFCVWWSCCYRTVQRVIPCNNKLRCYLVVREPAVSSPCYLKLSDVYPAYHLSSITLPAIWRAEFQAIHLHSKMRRVKCQAELFEI